MLSFLVGILIVALFSLPYLIIMFDFEISYFSKAISTTAFASIFPIYTIYMDFDQCHKFPNIHTPYKVTMWFIPTFIILALLTIWVWKLHFTEERIKT